MEETVEFQERGCMSDLDEVARLYAEHEVRVRRLVHLEVTAPDALVEDACQVAWLRLVANGARVGRQGALRWLVRVARHEALRLLARAGREMALDLVGQDEDEHEDETERLPAPPLMDDLAEHRSRLASLRTALPERQQRLVWMQGLGFSYAEIAGRTGDSRRTVERQLMRAKRTLADQEAA